MGIVSRISILFCFILVSISADAQLNQPCVDVNRIDPFFQCNDPSFLPVCGCDFKTYRNECVAFRNFGVNQIQYQGVCREDFLYADLYPTMSTESINLYFQFYQKSSATVQIRSSFGELMYSTNFPSIQTSQLTLDASHYKTGVYFVFVISGGLNTTLKFVKH